MAQFTKGTGKAIRWREQEISSTLMEIFISANGKMENPMEKDSMLILMAPNMKAIESTICSMALGQKPGPMEVHPFHYYQTARYEGEYSNGQKNGQGKYIWPDGSSYEGQFMNNNLSGFGTYHWADGKKYSGFWFFF